MATGTISQLEKSLQILTHSPACNVLPLDLHMVGLGFGVMFPAHQSKIIFIIILSLCIALGISWHFRVYLFPYCTHPH